MTRKTSLPAALYGAMPYLGLVVSSGGVRSAAYPETYSNLGPGYEVYIDDLALFILSITFTQAETRLWSVWVNNEEKGPDYIRGPLSNAPVRNLASEDMRCGAPGRKPGANKWLPVNEGDNIILEWHKDNATCNDIVIHPSKKGPVQIYIAGAETNGVGKVWNKLMDASYNAEQQQWGSEALRKMNGRLSVYVPNLIPGKYLLRPEILALHEADELWSQNPKRGVQVFTACVQIEVVKSPYPSSDPLAGLEDGIAIPGDYKDTSPGILWSMKLGGPGPWTYTSPGGKIVSYARTNYNMFRNTFLFGWPYYYAWWY
ncbi:hypothetical protein FRC03_007791 [Tulasnella sp. 419]|nr:hypothetical protein FRC02_006289 [Tulasnella sp. 418]KAG8968332.1 hypothetical protein FRC03_007791 [Tulasnella sp. 419]